VLGSSETDVKTEFVIVVFNRNKKNCPAKVGQLIDKIRRNGQK
jgi:hypothetical protein